MRGPGSLGGSGGLQDLSYYKESGTATWEAWCAGSTNGQVMTAINLLADNYYATGIIFPRAATLDRIGIYVTAGAGVNLGALAIYTSTSTSNLTPNTRVLDGGTVSLSAVGAVANVINFAVVPNILYWLAFVPSVNVTIRATNYSWPWLGMDNTFSNYASGVWTAASGYVTPMLSPFPACTPQAGVATPLIAVRLA